METRSSQRVSKKDPIIPSTEESDLHKMATPDDTSMDKMTALLAKLESSIKTMDESIKTLTTDSAINTDSIKKMNTDLKKRMDDLIANDTNNAQHIRAHEAKIEMLTADVQMLKKEMKERQRKEKELNVIIRGIPENKKEKMHETMSDLLTAAGALFNFSATNGAYRMGKLPNGQNVNKRTRSVKLVLATRQQKSELFGIWKQLKQNKKYEKTQIQSDMDDDDMLKLREVQQLHAMAKGVKDVTASIKGFNLVINGRVYERKEFDNLPHGLSREKASTIVTPDGMAFQGHCSPFSNMYPVEIADKDGKKASSNEHMFAKKMVEVCHADLDLAKQIDETTNPYTLKNLMKQIKANETWNNNKDKYLEDINIIKYNSHPSLIAKLQSVKGNFYEATFDPKYGCGYGLSQSRDITQNNVKPACNVMGKILDKVKVDHGPQDQVNKD